MTVFLYPSRTTEGAVYARMLEIELEQAGIPNLEYDEDAARGGERIGYALGIRCSLALLDTARRDHAEIGRALREEGIPLLFYGYARPDHATIGYDEPGDAEAGSGGARFFPRPVRVGELLASCRAILDAAEADPLYPGRSHKECAYGGRILHLTPIEYRVLLLLHERRGQTVSRAELYRSCWNPEASEGDGQAASNVVDACLRTLRKKLEEPLGRRLLYSVRGIGYRFEDRATGAGDKTDRS